MQGLRVTLVQFAPAADAATNREFIRDAVASTADTDVIVFPEYSSFFHTDPAVRAAAAELLDGEFVSSLIDCAATSGATVVAGFLERAGDQVFNTVVVVGPSGVLGRYRKIHLYDAFGARESDHLAAGSPEEPAAVFAVGDWTIGVQTCYDIRFPEVSRRLVDAGATVLVVPSDWVPGPHKVSQWHTLLGARAIENLCWVVAANNAEPSGTGGSVVIDPNGTRLCEAGVEPMSLHAELDEGVTIDLRQVNPALSARRFVVTPA